MPGSISIKLRRPALTLSVLALFLLSLFWFYFSNRGQPQLQLSEEAMESITADHMEPPTFEFQFVPGFFMQSDAATDPKDFNNTATLFGLIDQSFPSDTSMTKDQPLWKRFARYINFLNNESRPKDIFYKVLYFGRHGEGFHNVAEAFYGTKEWDDYWSKKDGNGTMNWVDAHLTELGKEQALANHDFMKAQLNGTSIGMPAPEAYYVSPMFRCLQTANLTWSNLTLPEDKSFLPVVKELLREVLGVHTCDKRSTKTAIHEAFPKFAIEDSFTEEDDLWTADHRETHAEHDKRTLELMNDIFAHDASTFISLTSHSGAIASHLRVFKHREFGLPTGGMMPVLVKASRASK